MAAFWPRPQPLDGSGGNAIAIREDRNGARNNTVLTERLNAGS
jgi:hypothetical protein